MRVVVLTNGQENQVALINKLSEHCEIAGVVFSKNIPRRKSNSWKRFRLLTNAVAARTVGRPFVDAWFGVMAKYKVRYPQLPATKVIEVSNINDQATVDEIESCAPDLVLVSGTNLVGRRLIETAQRSGSILNLHTGISPYVRGGPNCTNWCLAKGWYHLIGNTIMWLDIGIDTGNIIVTEQTPLDGSETLFDLHWKVMEHAHLIYTRTIERMAAGKNMPNIRQSEIDPGSHFNSADWTVFQIRKALDNFGRHYRQYFEDNDRRDSAESDLRLFPLDGD